MQFHENSAQFNVVVFDWCSNKHKRQSKKCHFVHFIALFHNMLLIMFIYLKLSHQRPFVWYSHRCLTIRVSYDTRGENTNLMTRRLSKSIHTFRCYGGIRNNAHMIPAKNKTLPWHRVIVKTQFLTHRRTCEKIQINEHAAILQKQNLKYASILLFS